MSIIKAVTALKTKIIHLPIGFIYIHVQFFASCYVVLLFFSRANVQLFGPRCCCATQLMEPEADFGVEAIGLSDRLVHPHRRELCPSAACRCTPPIGTAARPRPLVGNTQAAAPQAVDKKKKKKSDDSRRK